MQTITGTISCDSKIVHGAGFKMARKGETKMSTRAPLTSNLQRILFILLVTIVLGGCSTTSPSSDGIRVTSSSEMFTAAAKSLVPQCRLSAEFGRCGCYLDGLQTSCDIVSRCLEAGFCKVAQSQPAGTKVTSDSETFKTGARSLAKIPGYCSAEFGRCGCFLNGSQTSCAFVNRCLENGFCKKVAQ